MLKRIVAAAIVYIAAAAAKKMNVKDVIKSETANILTTEHKVVLLSEFDLEDIFYVDDDGNIKDR